MNYYYYCSVRKLRGAIPGAVHERTAYGGRPVWRWRGGRGGGARARGGAPGAPRCVPEGAAPGALLTLAAARRVRGLLKLPRGTTATQLVYIN